METKTVEEIVRLRADADVGDALKRYWDGLATLVQSPEVWTAQIFADFEHIAYDIFRWDIRPVFEDLDKRRGIGIKDAITALGPEAAAEGVKSAGKLIVQSPTATIAKGLAAIGDLGFSLAARFAAGLVQRWQELRKKHERAKFMTYPLRLKAAADIKK